MSTLIVVTGASRGIGLSICTSFAAKLSSSPLHFLLLARSEPNLAAAASSIASSYTGSSSELTIESHSVNFSYPVSTSKCESVLKAIPWFSTAWTILVNNAGSLGDLTAQSIAPNLADLTATINLNATSPVYLTSLFLSQLPPTLVPHTQNNQPLIPRRRPALPNLERLLRRLGRARHVLQNRRHRCVPRR